MKLFEITKLVAREGLIGLQKLEAQKDIQGDFPQRVGNIHDRGRDGKIALAISRGIGTHDDLEKVLEMINWLRDGEYLVDYGYLTVSLARSVRYENPTSLAQSKFIAILDYFRNKYEDEDDIFDVNFLLDYRKKFCPDVVEWLLKIQSRSMLPNDRILVKTKFGYAYCYREDFPEAHANNIIHLEVCLEPGMHYNRYAGIICSD